MLLTVLPACCCLLLYATCGRMSGAGSFELTLRMTASCHSQEMTLAGLCSAAAAIQSRDCSAISSLPDHHDIFSLVLQLSQLGGFIKSMLLHSPCIASLIFSRSE
jgi:hypothetical protein